MITKLEKFVSKNWYVVTFFAIVAIAAVLRFYKLGAVPQGMTWDEAAIGYNGFAVVSTRRDEWLTFLPLSFKSFGDFKAPFAIYLNGLFTAVFGLELWVVRLPFALSGILAVVGSMLLTKTLLGKHPRAELGSLLVGYAVAVSPWHMHFTRTGFESGLALTMIIWGVYFFVHAWTQEKFKSLKLAASVGLLILSLYTYHSTKVSAPLLGLFLVWMYRKQIFKKVSTFLLPVLVGVVGMVPLVFDLFFRNGLERAGVTIFAQGYSFVEVFSLAVKQFAVHLHPAFLLFGETTTLRHGDGIHGVLYPTTFALVLWGITWITWNFYKKHHLPKEIVTLSLFAVVFTLLGILPAAIAIEVPHSNRALTASLGFWMLATVGLLELLRWAEQHKEIKSLRDSRDRKTIYFQLILGTYILLHSLFAADYVSYYFKGYARDSADAFKDGYIQAFNYVVPYETGANGTHEVQNIIFTSTYGQPYIYALFARKTSPYSYHSGSLVKYLFQDSFVEGDLNRENTIIVTSPNDVMPFNKAEYVVAGSDGQPRFYIFDTTKVK